MPIKHVPCGPFVNWSEQTAFDQAARCLNAKPGADHWVLFTNLAHAYSAQQQADEIDQLTVSPVGISVVEVKHWDQKYLKAEPEVIKSEARKLVEKVKKVATKVRKSFSGLPRLTGKFLLTAEARPFGAKRPVVDDCEFFSLTELPALFRPDDPPVFTPDEAQRVALLLEPLSKVPLNGDLRRLNNITEMNLLTPREERFHRVYNGKLATTRDKLIVHLYDLSAYHGPPARPDQIVAVAQREFTALQALQKLPWLPRFMDSFQAVPGYPGELYFFSVVDPLAPPLSRRAGDPNWAFPDRLTFARTTVRAVREMHDAGGHGTPFLHRNLNPETLLVRANSEVLLTGLHLARVPDALTVATTVAPTTGDRFVAPEVRTGGLAAASPLSDAYSLCQSLLLLAPDGSTGLAAALRGVLLRGAAEDIPGRTLPAGLEQEIEALAAPSPPPRPTETVLPPPADWDEGLVIPFNNHFYRIVTQLGSGGYGTTFRVLQVDPKTGEEFGNYVAKAAHDPGGVGPLLRAYRRVRPHTADARNMLSVVFDTAAEEDANGLLALLKWVEGEPLNHLNGVVELYAEDQEESAEVLALRWLADLCDGLAVLHKGGLVHGDVSPRNIIYRNDTVTLTDYDLVLGHGEPLTSPGTPLYAPQEAAVGRPANSSHDVFALAATFFHVVFDRPPFAHVGADMPQPWRGLNWVGSPRERWSRLAGFLDRATDPNPDRRFPDAARAREELLRLLAPPVAGQHVPPPAVPPASPAREPREIPWLLDLLRLYPGSRYGNIETRGLDSDFAGQTYVETELERRLVVQIQAGDVRLVILCGNAGDGKTALLQHLIRQLGLPLPASQVRVWKGQIPNGPRVSVNFDGSAAFQNRPADSLLDEFFEPFHDGKPPAGEARLLAINDGRLLEWVEGYESRFGQQTELTRDLRRALDDELPPSYLQFRNLNIRSLVGGYQPGSDELSNEFLDRLVDSLLGANQTDAIWSPCGTCTSEGYCPVNRTVRLLRQPESGRLVRDRMYAALRAVHQQGQYHITMRELRAVLSYVFFGLDSCKDVNEKGLSGADYFDRAFAAKSPRRQGDLLAALVRLDPGLESHPRIDRELLRNPDPDGSASVGPLPDDPTQRRAVARVRLASARRRAYFEWSGDRINKVGLPTDIQANSHDAANPLGLTGGRWLDEFTGVVRLDDARRASLCRRLCRGIARLEDLPPTALSRLDTVAAVPLKVTPQTPVETTFWVEKSLDRFDIEAEQFPAADGIETLPREVVLRYQYARGGEERLALNLDLFGLLLDLADGHQLVDVGSDDTFANLAVFKRRLAQEDAEFLHAWHPGVDGEVLTIKIESTSAGEKGAVRQLKLIRPQTEGAPNGS